MRGWIIGLVCGALLTFVLMLAFRPHPNDAHERILRDSIAAQSGQISTLREHDKEQTIVLTHALSLLDSALQTPPRVVYVTRRDTIRLTDDSSIVSDVPVPYVPQADYDTLKSRCSLVERNCTALLATKDSLQSRTSADVESYRSLLALRDRDVVRIGRRNVLRDVKAAGLAGGVGMLLGCVLWCFR